MIIYVNGDSHSAGHEAGGPAFSYGKYISDILGAQFVCDATAGCSNDYIINKTLTYLETNTPDFIIIGWSTWERETWTIGNRSYNITSSGHATVPLELQNKYKQWVTEVVTPENQRLKERTNHENIWKLHQTLKQRNIKHLFFNSYSHFFYTVAHNDLRYDWGDNYIDPYNQNSTYYYWLENKGFKPVNPKWYHYDTNAHAAWAEFLLSRIKKLLT